jgi:four helix bundle protein
MMEDFKNLKVWSKAHGLTLAVYQGTRTFPKDEIYGLTSQIRRASASIGANIAEGCGRRSDPEMRRFVQIARGSANELEYHLLLAKDLQFLTPEEYQRTGSENMGNSTNVSSAVPTIAASGFS